MVEEDATLGRIGGFRLIKRLATGGTSDVLLARAEGPHGFERTVVLKRLLSEHQQDPDFSRMFAREAAAYARLSHPAIVRLFDFFTSNGQLVMVLEYIDGVSLAKLMTHAGQTNERLDDRVCYFLAARIFDALSAAHDARNPDTSEPTPVIHRDVNPSNVLIPWDGHAKLADFGIAKITGAETDGAVETTQGLIKGTYGYMAPEQVRGERVTIRTDVYAATLVLWELLARRKAIQADRLPEMEILRAMAEPNLPSLDVLRPDVHESIREAIARGLEPNPAKRSMTAEEMVGTLRAHFEPEEARQRLVTVLLAMSPRRPLSDTLAEDMRQTSDAAAQPFNPTKTLPLSTEPKARPPIPRPTMRGYAPQPPAANTAAAVLADTASALEPLHRQTPSGFRPISVPPAPIPPAPPAPPIPVPFASDAPTLETRKVDTHDEPTVAGPLPVPQHHPPPPAPWPAPPPAFAAPPLPPHAPPPPPMHVAPSAQPPQFPPILPSAGPSKRLGAGFVVAIGAGALLGVLSVVAVIVAVVARAGTAESVVKQPEPPPTATHVAATAPATTATSTTAAIKTSPANSTVPSARPVASLASASSPPIASAAPTASAAPKATVSAGMPTPAADEGVLVLPPYAHDHRIYVDGHVKGDGSSPIVVRCGPHTVQIGSQGKPREVTIPCGALAKIE